jgi:hypothetical protein
MQEIAGRAFSLQTPGLKETPVTARTLVVPTALAAFAAVLVSTAAPSATVPRPTPPAPTADPVVVSGQAQPEDLALTVYNGGLALVCDVRSLNLPSGELRLRVEDIAGHGESRHRASAVHLAARTMQSSSHRSTRTDAFAARFNMPVAAGAEATLRYRVRATW